MNLKPKEVFIIVMNLWSILGIVLLAISFVAVIWGLMSPLWFLASLLFVAIPASIGLSVEIRDGLDKISKALSKYTEEK